jgi:nucleobase:cation symporter-1, NCS1 family
MNTSDSRTKGRKLVERRSIDYIPEAERHGSLFSQFTLWLGANLQVTAVVVGALAVVLGGDVFWSLVGLLIGQMLGGAVMALHSAQGPQLGLPQMISSRVQFGVYGAIIPLALVCVMYVGFSAGGTVLAGQAIGQLLQVDNTTAILVFAALIVMLTVLGYRTIHVMGRVSSVVGVLAFLYLFASLLHGHDIGALLDNRHFTVGSFLLAMPTTRVICRSRRPRSRPSLRSVSAPCSARRSRWSSACSRPRLPAIVSRGTRCRSSSDSAQRGRSPRCSTSR